MIIIFGDYIKVDERYPSEFANDQSVGELSKVLVDSVISIRQLWGVQKAETIKSLLFDNACSAIDSNIPFFDLHTKICEKALDRPMGWLAYLNKEKDQYDSAWLLINKTATFPKFLNQSRTALVASPLQTVFLTNNWFQLKLSHMAVVQGVLKLLAQYTAESINSSQVRIDKYLYWTSGTTVLGLLVALCAGMYHFHRLFQADAAITVEVTPNLS